jgi:Rnl2 family RNA ligase
MYNYPIAQKIGTAPVFVKYSSIENSYRERFIGAIQASVDPTVEFVALEKIHGANFQIAITHNAVAFGSRSKILSSEELAAFYHADIITDALAVKAREVWDYLEDHGYQQEQLVIYGELFGGSYPDADIERVPGVSRVQKGVYYSPNLEFAAFDLVRICDQTRIFVDWSSAESILVSHGFRVAPTIATGSLDDCLALDVNFITRVPENLPTIENNFAEGLVIKPLHTQRFLPNGDRMIIKNKAEKFKERVKTDREPAAQPSDREKQLVALIGEYVNENRYNSVCSKIGDVDYSNTKMIGVLLAALSQDALEDFFKDNDVTADEQKLVKKAVVDAAKKIVLIKF